MNLYTMLDEVTRDGLLILDYHCSACEVSWIMVEDGEIVFYPS